MLDKQQTLTQQAEQQPSLSEWAIKLKSLDDVSKELRALIKTIPFGAFLLHTDAFVEAVDVEIKVRRMETVGRGMIGTEGWKEKSMFGGILKRLKNRVEKNTNKRLRK